DLGRAGIKVNFQTFEDGNAANALTTEGKAGPMFGNTWGSYSVFDADGIYWDMFNPTTIFSYWKNDDFIKLIETGRSTVDESARLQAYAEAQRIVRDEAPVIFMWGLHSIWGVS